MSGNLDGDAAVQAPHDWGVARSLMLDNPELVRDDDQLLQALGLRAMAGNVIDFGAAALARLEAARDKEVAARTEVEALARANHIAQVETHALVVDLLEANNPADLAFRLNEGVQRRFGLEAGSLAMEGLAPPGWRSLPPGLLDHVLGAHNLCAVGPCTGGREMFAERADNVKSVALVRMALCDPARQGVLAFGSADPDGFTTDMGVELIAFIARVVERTAERWAQPN